MIKIIMKIFSVFYSTIIFIIKRLFILTELFMLLRLALKFLGANPETLIVGMIYKYSSILVSPFLFIFPNFYWKGYMIEIATVSAMVGYGIVFFAIIQLLKIFSKN
jgi:hypothetical protein